VIVNENADGIRALLGNTLARVLPRPARPTNVDCELAPQARRTRIVWTPERRMCFAPLAVFPERANKSDLRPWGVGHPRARSPCWGGQCRLQTDGDTAKSNEIEGMPRALTSADRCLGGWVECRRGR